MCGRFTLSTPAHELVQQFELQGEVPELRARYNIAPTQQVTTVRVVLHDEQQGRKLHRLRWGLIPSWARDPAIGNRLINARGETVASKPAFRSAFKSRRCLVLADGFFEWQRRGKVKVPHLIRMRDGRPFAFGGLWEQWIDPQGEVVESCTIITTEANALIAEVHHRMPVVLRPADYDLWLDPEVSDVDQLQPLLRPFPADQMETRPVSTLVNSVRNDSPACLDPDEQGELF